MKKNINRIILVLIIALLLNLVSCLPMSEDQINAQAQKKYAKLLEPTKVVVEAQKIDKSRKKSDLADKQILNMSGRYFFYMDPALSYNTELIFMNQIYVGLTRQDWETREFKPVMAKTWDVSEDGLTWTFHIRENVAWVEYDEALGQVQEVKDDLGNTRYVNAEDFKTGLLRVLDPQTYSGNAFNLFNIVGAQNYNSGIESMDNVGIQTPSDSELVIQLIQPVSSLDAIAELPIFSAYPSWDPYVLNALHYTYGPYAVKEYDSSASLTLIRNPFWKSTEGLQVPVLEEIHYNLDATADALASYKAGELDAVELSSEEYQTALNDPGLKDDIHIFDGDCGYYLVFFNTDMPPLNAPEVRQAIAASIDKDKLNEIFTSGTGQVLDQYVPAYARGSQEYNGKVGIAYDPEKAQASLSELGLEGIHITLVSADSINYTNLAYSIKEDIETNLGLSVTFDTYPWTEYMNSVYYNYYTSGMYIYGYCMDYADAQNLWDRWLQTDIYADVQNLRWFNQTFFDSLNQANGSFKLSDREDLYQKAEEIIVNEDTVIVPLVIQNHVWLAKPNLDISTSFLYPQMENWAFLK